MRMWLSTLRKRLPFLPQGWRSRRCVVLFLQEGRALQRHGSADVIVGGLDIGFREAEMPQHVKARIGQLLSRDAQRAGAELLAQRPLVEDEADVEGRGQCRLDLLDLRVAEAVADQCRVVDPGRVAERAVTDGVATISSIWLERVAQRFKGRRHRAVDDLEVAAAGELLELHQREVRLDARGVAVHDQTDGAGGRDHGGLRVAVAVELAQLQRLVPGLRRQSQTLVRAVAMIERHRLHREIS